MEVILTKSYYPSLCFYALKKLGLMGQEPDPEYSDLAEEMIELGEQFDFKPPIAGGPLFTILYQFPSNLDPATIKDMEVIEEVLIEVILTKSFDPIMKLSDKFNVESLFLYQANQDLIFSGLNSADTSKAKPLVKKFFDFLKTLWPEYRKVYEKKLADYPFEKREIKLNDLDIFKKWHQAMDYPYPDDQFVCVICPESKTLASSLGYDKIVVSSQCSWQQLRHAIVHEIGVRIPGFKFLETHPATSNLMKNDYYNLLLLIESEVCHRKNQILSEIKEDPFLGSTGWTNIYNWRRKQQLNEDYPELISKLYRRGKEEEIF